MRISHCLTVLALLPIAVVAPSAAADPAGIRCAGVNLAPALGADPDVNPDGSPVAITPDSRGKFVPVVMVHGWTGRSTHDDSRTGAFSHKIDLTTNQLGAAAPTRSLIGQLQRIPGAAVFTFDYHDYSARWVDDPHIGPALGSAIDCLYQATGEKVIIVAHSMGGLATRYALTQKAERATKVSTVVTFGTPESGSLVAMLGDTGLDIGAAGNKALSVLRLILSACGQLAGARLETGTPCDFLPEPARAFDSPAGKALRYGSSQLAALKPFPREVKVDALAGDTVLTVPKAGWFHLPWDTDQVPVGDLVVMTSGRFYCGITPSSTDSPGMAGCQGETTPVPPRPPDCGTEISWGGGLYVDDTGEVDYVCAGGPMFSDGNSKVLPYGAVLAVAGMTCTSAETGMRCVDDGTGHGFRIASASNERF